MFLLYEEIEEPILEPISPAPASQIHEPTIPRIEEIGFQGGNGRTILLTIGSALGVLATAILLHGYKQGSPGKEPKGWTRTGILASGAAAGTLISAGMIHLAKRTEINALKKLSLVEEI